MTSPKPPHGSSPDPRQTPASSVQQVIRDLRDLVIALDRRVPHLERTGEVDIARDAAALRKIALQRIAELEARSGS